jgi:hypothetical protein
MRQRTGMAAAVAATAVTPRGSAPAPPRAKPTRATMAGGFPWGGFIMITLAVGLVGPIARRAHHFGVEVDHKSWAALMWRPGVQSGTPDAMLLHAARDGDERTARGSLRRGADPDVQEGVVRCGASARACVQASDAFARALAVRQNGAAHLAGVQPPRHLAHAAGAWRQRILACS